MRRRITPGLLLRVNDTNLYADFKRVMHAQYKTRASYARERSRAATPHTRLAFCEFVVQNHGTECVDLAN